MGTYKFYFKEQDEEVVTLLTKYPHLSLFDAQCIIDKAKMFYFALRYPSGTDENSTKELNNSEKLWVMSACEEIIERAGVSSATAYSENGLHLTFDNSQLSKTLTSLVMPTIGVLK